MQVTVTLTATTPEEIADEVRALLALFEGKASPVFVAPTVDAPSTAAGAEKKPRTRKSADPIVDAYNAVAATVGAAPVVEVGLGLSDLAKAAPLSRQDKQVFIIDTAKSKGGIGWLRATANLPADKPFLVAQQSDEEIDRVYAAVVAAA